jgi:hypothetical protein
VAFALHKAARMKPHARLRSRALASVLSLAIGACAVDVEPGVGEEPDYDTTEEELGSSVSGVGPESGVDWSIDAPWRMEPVVAPNGAGSYDPIPITLTFHDADMQWAGHELPLNRLCGVDILELQPAHDGVPEQTWMNARRTFVAAEDFHEIEATLRWTAAGVLTPTPEGVDAHIVRRLWNDEPADDVLKITPWAEWHGTFLYTPQAEYAGKDLRLILMARVSRFGSTCTPLDLNRFELMYQLKRGQVTRYPVAIGPLHETTDSIYFSEFLKVTYGDPLPRFDDRWVYGDVHYHSQGTDNEGESALSFRATLAAMKAFGLDYAFATDHTSAGTQVSGVGMLIIDQLPQLPWILDWDFIKDRIKEAVANIQVPVVQRDALRDMNEEKFATLHGWLNAPDGANAQVLSFGGSSRAPQMFLGGEVDVIPELSDAEAAQGYIAYGVGQKYDVFTPCYAVHDILETYTNWETVCSQQMLTTGSAYGRKAIRDVQGPLDVGYFSRQHLVHLPSDPTRTDTGVIGHTTVWGGATLSLKSFVEDHLTAQQKGYAFLAHPADATGGDGALRLGPDIVPYSRAQLEVAFASPYILGLQLWNADSHVTTGAPAHGGSHVFPFLFGLGHDDPEIDGYIQTASLPWNWQELTTAELLKGLRHGSAMWDMMNLWGITPSRTAAIGLPAGQYRKVFMAGGSDAHGDLNYRRNGRILGTFYATDSAMGAPRNLTYVDTMREGRVDDGGAGQATLGQTQVIEALRSGRFSVTDGPALRIAIDANGNDFIDDGDIHMGQDFSLTGATAPLLVEWKSTSEWGPVREVDVYVGVQAGNRAVVYAPKSHGAAGNGVCTESESPITDPEGNVYCPMDDGYVANDALRVNVASGQGMGGTARFDIDPRNFKLFDLQCTTQTIPAPTPDGEPQQWEEITHCKVDRTEVASRLFVRAFAQTDDTIDAHAIHRYAFTNPIWLHGPVHPTPPTASLTHLSCTADVNTFSASVSGGTGTVEKQSRNGAGAWTTFAGTTFTTPAGAQLIGLRARTCDGGDCSGYDLTSATGTASCPAPIPSPPKVMLEYVGCSQGKNSFAVTVGPLGNVPPTSYVKQYKIASGSWTTLTSSKITANSQQAVYLRAKACNANGCSAYAQTSKAGPTCSGTGPLPQ